MSAHTFLHLLKSKFDKTFKEKRLIFEVGKVSDAAAGAATEGTDTKAELDTLEEQEGEAKKEIEAVSKDGQGVEAEAAAKAAIKETAIDNALNPTTITEDQFKALFSEEGLEVKTEKETITVKINELTSGQMDRVMTFVTANPTLTKSIVKAVKEGQIKSEQLGVSARKMVLKGALEMDEGDLRKVIENLTNTKAGIAATISAAERNKPIMKILLQVVEEQRDIPKITENALSIIITTLGFEEAMETLKDNLTFDQKASLLNIEDSTITKKEKEPLFLELNKNKEKLNTNSLTNIINFGLSRDGTPEAIGTFIMGLSSVKDKISKIAKKEMFAYIIKNPEIHEQRIKDFVEIYYNTQEKIDLIQDTTLDEKIRNAIEATLRAEEKTQLEQKKIEQAKAKDTKEAGIESEFTKLSPEAKLKAAEFIVAKRIKFFMPKDSKSERHFIKRAWHLEEIGKCETKEAVKLRVYQFLLGIIKSDGSYVDNRNKVVNFKESNAKMIAEIKRLEELVLKEKVVDPQAEDTTAKPEAGSAKPAEADAAKPAVADAITETTHTPKALQGKISETKELSTLLKKHLSNLTPTIKPGEKEGSILEISFEKEKDFPKISVLETDGKYSIEYTSPIVGDIKAIKVEGEISAAELATVIETQYYNAKADLEYSNLAKEYLEHPEKLEELKISPSNQKILDLDPEDSIGMDVGIDRSYAQLTKNWEKIEGHELIEDILTKKPFNIAKKDIVEAVSKMLYSQYPQGKITFKKILSATNAFEYKGKIETNPEKFAKHITWLQEEIVEQEEKEDKDQEAIDALRTEYRKTYDILTGSLRLMEALKEAKLLDSVPNISIPPLEDPEFQHVGTYSDVNGDSIPVYADAEGTFYTNLEGGTKEMADPFLRKGVEKDSEKAEKAVEKATLIKAKKEYVKSTLFPKLEEAFKGKIETKNILIKGEKVEIKLKTSDGQFSDIVMTIEPNMEFDKTTKAWNAKNLTLLSKTPFTQFENSTTIKPEISAEKLYKTIQHQYLEIKEDLSELAAYGKRSLDFSEYKIKGLDQIYDLSDPKLIELAKGDSDKFEEYFGNMTNHEAYEKTFEKYFGITRTEVPNLLQKIIKKGSPGITFQEVLEITGKTAALENISDTLFGKTYSTKKFKDRFNFLLQEVNEKVNLHNADGSPNPEAEEKRKEYSMELKGLYDVYIGTYKLLSLIQGDTFKPTLRIPESQKLKFQIEQTVGSTETPQNGEYFNLDEIISEKPELKGSTEIGITESTRLDFSLIYLKTTGKELPDTITNKQILETIFDIYEASELIGGRFTLVDHLKGKPSKLVLRDLPKNFTENSAAVKGLMATLEGGKPIAKEKIKEAKRSLSQGEEVYREKVLELLKMFQSASVESSWEWFSGAAPVGEEITLRATHKKYYDYEKSEIRRFTSPESMADHLIEEPTREVSYYDPVDKLYVVEEVKIFEWQNGIKEFTKDGLAKYFNLLILKGLRKQQLAEEKQEKIYDFEDMAKYSSEIGAEKFDKTTLETFKTNGTLESWKKIPGHERIDSLLTSAPFSISKEKVHKKIHELIKGKEEIKMESIFAIFLRGKIKKAYPTKEINNVKNLVDEYEHVIGKANEIKETLEEKDYENIKEKAALEAKLIEYRAKYFTLKTFVDAGAILMQRLGKLGEGIPKFQDFKIPTDKPFPATTFTEKQVGLLTGGYITELQTDKSKQDLEGQEIKESLSKHPYIAKIQMAAIEAGYPEGKAVNIENYLLAGGFVGFEGRSLTTGGAGFAIPIGEGHSIAFGASNKGAGVSIAFQVVKTEKYSGKISIGGGSGYKGGTGFGQLAYISTHEVSDTLDFSWAIGGIMTATGPKLMLGAALHYNEERATEVAISETNWKDGYEKIEDSRNPKEKVKLIKELPEFEELKELLDDEDILAVYEQYKEINIQEGYKKGKPSIPFTGIGLGIAFPPLSGFIGVKIRLGSITLIKPKVGERERLAKILSESTIQKLITEKLKNPDPQVKFSTEALYTDENGRFGILQNKKETKPTSNLEYLNSEFENQNMRMHAEKSKIKIGKPEKEEDVIKLSILDWKKKGIKMYVDEDCYDLELILDKKTGEIYLPGGSLDGLIIRRETFKDPYAVTKGGATSFDVIIITKNPNVSRQKVIEESHNLVEKKWQGGETSGWDIEKGFNTGGKDSVSYLEDYKSEKGGKPKKTWWKHQDFVEKVYGIPKEDFAKIQKTKQKAKGLFSPETKEGLESLNSRFEGITVEDFKTSYFNEMKRSLRKGKPAVFDFEGIITKANKGFFKNPNLNAKETAQFLSAVQHLYFVDIVEKAKKKKNPKEAIKKVFRKHNETIKKTVLIPRFEAKIIKLKIAPRDLSGIDKGILAEIKPAILNLEKPTTREYANFIATRVTHNELQKFEASIDTIKSLDELSAPDSKLITEIPADQLFYTGTTVRDTKKGALTGGIGLFTDTGIEGVTRMGLIDTPTKWDQTSKNPIDKDIAKVLMDTISPVPTLKDVETLQGPLAIKLLAFEGTGLELGEKMYAQVVDVYETLKSKTKAKDRTAYINSLTKEPKVALEKFIKFCEDARASVEAGKEGIELSNGTKMYSTAEVSTASYGQCGNFSMLGKEEFFIADNQNIILASSSIYIHTNTKVSKKIFDITLGIALSKGEEQKKKEPRKPRTKKPETPPRKASTKEIGTGKTGAPGTDGAPTGNPGSTSPEISSTGAPGTDGAPTGNPTGGGAPTGGKTGPSGKGGAPTS